MATPRTARILSSTPAGARGRLLQLELTDGDALGFTGGQYLIFDTGVVRADGRAHKRAYSIVSADAEQRVFSVCVFRLPEGPGSRVLSDAPVGAEFQFSGPWGSYLPDDATPRRTLLLATDSGITAALGLIQGAGFRPQRERSHLVWFSHPDFGFTEPGWVESTARAVGVEVERVACPRPGESTRALLLPELSARALQAHPAQSVFLSGDGAALSAVRERLLSAGLSAPAIRLESFFNHPARKAAA